MLLVYVVLEVGKFSAERNIKHQTNDHKSNKTDLVGFESRSKTTLIKTFKGLDGIQWKGFGVSKVLKGFNDHTVEIFCWILKKPQATEIFGGLFTLFYIVAELFEKPEAMRTFGKFVTLLLPLLFFTFCCCKNVLLILPCKTG